jgi:hypothetical protein
MDGFKHILFLTAGLLCVAGCGVSDSDDEPDNGLQTVTYTLTTQVSPPEGGSVDPTGGQYNHGSSVTVQADPNQGWIFTEWSGDFQSQDNPLVFTIEADTDLTANFEDARSEYSVVMNLSGNGAVLDYLEFGQMENPIAEQAPPSPPEGALHAFFSYNGYELFKDYRYHFEQVLVWELHYQASDGDSLSLSWEVDVVKMEGRLTLTDPDSDFEIDMLDESTFEFQSGNHGYFLIHYKYDYSSGAGLKYF